MFWIGQAPHSDNIGIEFVHVGADVLFFWAVAENRLIPARG